MCTIRMPYVFFNILQKHSKCRSMTIRDIWIEDHIQDEYQKQNISQWKMILSNKYSLLRLNQMCKCK